MTDKLDKLRQLVAKDSEGLFVKLPELKEEWEAKKCCSGIGCTIAFALAKIDAALGSALAEEPETCSLCHLPESDELHQAGDDLLSCSSRCADDYHVFSN